MVGETAFDDAVDQSEQTSLTILATDLRASGNGRHHGHCAGTAVLKAKSSPAAAFLLPA